MQIKTGCQEYHKQVEIKTILGREDECSGCGGCVALCPKKCISLGKDKNGFLVPVINTQTCIECGLCKNVCPMQNYNDKHIPVKTYAAVLKKSIFRVVHLDGLVILLGRDSLKIDG